MFGTVRYASYNASRGVEQSRRDDLESIANMLIYIYTGKLPWKGINLKDRQRKKKYLEMLLLKKFTSPEKICEGMPKEYVEFYKYCKNLKFEQDPDYEYLRNIFRKILINCMEYNDYKFSWILNKNYYLKSLKLFNHKINTQNIKQEKYINILTRANSPGNRLYHIIKNSLEKNELEKYKKTVGNSENIFTHNNINSNLDLDSVKTYNRGASEDMIQISGKNDISENQVNLTKSKMDFTYKSDISQYNMNVDEFQDETKICEQNKTMINMIKNNENDKLNNNSYIELQSFNKNSIFENKNSNNKFDINQILNNFKMNDDIKDKLNLSMDLGFNYNKNKKNNSKKYNNKINRPKNNMVNENRINYICNNDILNEIKDDVLIRPKSQDIKTNFTKIINLTDKESEIKKNQEELYNYIFNRIKNYVNKFLEKRLYQSNIINKKFNNNNRYFKKIISRTDKNTYNEEVSSNFSFKNLNMGNNIGNNLSKNINNQYKQKNNNNIIYNSHQNEIKITKAINTTKINNSFNNNDKVKRENNIHKKMPSNNNILDNNKRINIIINTTLNSFGKPSQKHANSKSNIFNNTQKLSPYKKSNPLLNNNNINNIHLVNSIQNKNNNNTNNLYSKEFRDNNFMKKLSNNKNNIIIIPKQKRPLITKNTNFQFINGRNKFFNFSNNEYFSRKHQTNLSLNNFKNLTTKSKINNSDGQMSSEKNIRTFEYKSIFNQKKNSEEKNMKNILKENINVFKLQKLGIKKLTKNNSYDSIPYKINLQKKFNHLSLSCSNQNITNTNTNKIQNYDLNLKNKKNLQIRIKHYSPNNNMYKNKYVNLFSKNGNVFSNIMNKRSNSDSKKKKVLNYNNMNLSDNENTRSSIHKPMNLNNLNNYNYIPLETKCYNFMKI